MKIRAVLSNKNLFAFFVIWAKNTYKRKNVFIYMRGEERDQKQIEILGFKHI